jgi:HSP20 family protein
MSGRTSRGAKGEGPGVSWDPLRELTGLKERLNHVFESALRRGGASEPGEFSGWAPVVDLREERDAFVLTAELPGVPKGVIRIRLEGHTLILEGERPMARESRHAEHLRVERTYGPFSRSFQLPAGVDEKGVAARVSRGVLEVRLPKTARGRSGPVRIRVV